jgi:hypothetical protein
LLQEKYQKKLFVRWLEIRRRCFQIAKKPHKFRKSLTELYFDESMIRVFAKMIETEHYDQGRHMKYRQVDFKYNDVSLVAIDKEYGSRFSSAQV